MAQSCTTEGYLDAMKEVLVLTERRYEGDGSLSNMPQEYVDNVLQEDGLVVDALVRVGFAAKRVAWCNDGIRWDACAAALFRTTWDYFDRWETFSAWLNHASDRTTLFNDPASSDGTSTSTTSKTWSKKASPSCPLPTYPSMATCPCLKFVTNVDGATWSSNQPSQAVPLTPTA